ncbi:MAG: hypothetical protein IJ647_10045 [Prevotella sp.]|nr:hypothetical protein [Prevotella sp.]
MERKTKRIYIRLTPDDEALFRRKAARYQTVSAMVRDAVKQFDDTATLGKIDALHAMMEYYKRYEQQLSWLGSNFNQSVHRANELAISEELTPQFFEQVLYPQTKEIIRLIQELKRQLSQVAIQLTKL